MYTPRLPLLLTLALGVLSFGAAHRIEGEPGEKECFYETLQPQDRVGHCTHNSCSAETHGQMTVTYEVGGSSGGGHLDIDFYVSAAGPRSPRCC